MAGPLIERSLALRSFRLTYLATKAAHDRHPAAPSLFAFFDSALAALDARVETLAVGGPRPPAAGPGSVPPSVPAAGPLIVVCNHPFGLLDPVALGWWLAGQRDDVRVMANSLLGAIPEVAPWLIPVDPFGAGQRRNVAPMRRALEHLGQDGVLMLFPAGEVAHYRPGDGVSEGPWSRHLGTLVRRSGAAVLPVHVDGRNSLLFQAAGLVHPRLRTGLLLRELKRQRHRRVLLRIGPLLPPTRLARLDDDRSLTRYLRLTTLMLGRRRSPADPAHKPSPSVPRPRGPALAAAAPAAAEGRGITCLPAPGDPDTTIHPDKAPASGGAGAFPGRRRTLPVAPAGPAAAILTDVEQLRAAGAVLVSQGRMSVLAGMAGQLPAVLPEIGRLRELTFRQVGEGSGRERDLDRFDAHYLHLFLWDERERRIAGAYRMARADELVRRHGPSALYTSTLFRFEAPFLDRLEGALELGRSFIRPEYQRDLGALPLLWRGIGRWIAAHPGYRQLFGPVSISRDYDGLSRRLIVEFLRNHRWHAELAPQVHPRRPFRYLGSRRWLREFTRADLRDVDEFSSLIATIEPDGKGLPVLLKHYLRLQGTLLAFNVDKEFGSVLDGLILVDLPSCDQRVLGRYLGDTAARAYLQRHHAAGS